MTPRYYCGICRTTTTGPVVRGPNAGIVCNGPSDHIVIERDATTPAHNLGTLRVLTVLSHCGRRTLENASRVHEALKGFGTRLRTYAREGR